LGARTAAAPDDEAALADASPAVAAAFCFSKIAVKVSFLIGNSYHTRSLSRTI
jgi:hypothetical protein